MPAIPILCVVGRSRAGKTTLLEKLIPEFKRRGYRVSSVKHHPRPGLKLDQPGTDTWRHAQAGSDQVVLVAPDQLAVIRRVEREPTLDEITAAIHDADIILCEGYKRAEKPKIEVVRAACGAQLLCAPHELLAVVSDTPLGYAGLAQFTPDDIVGLANLIESRLL